MTDPDQPKCPNCDAGHHADDVFCESCGYDFITGSLPDDADEASTVPVGLTEAEGETSTVSLTIEVAVDPVYFRAVVQGGELELPDPVPAPTVVSVSGPEIHIGRTSSSRNIHPDLDIAALTADPAVSSRHAVLRFDVGSGLWITDLGSTNGTTIGSPSAPLLAAETATSLALGSPVFLGAWTRVTVTLAEPPALG